LQDCFVNAGIYVFKKDFLKKYVTSLAPHENSNEIYLTDLIEIAHKNKLTVSTVNAPFDTVRGVNTLKELWAAEQIQRSAIIEHWMSQGVRFSYAQSTHIDVDVTIGSGTCIEAGVQLLSGTRIGKQCTVKSYACIKNSILSDQVTIQSHTVVTDATIGELCVVGPFAHIHNNSVIGSESIIGNFVEVTKSSIAHKTKIKHLSYIGNAHIGSYVNIGAGTIICNYNGVTKNTTIIEDHAFVGSNNALIAPVTIAQHAMTAAGSVITDSVPPHALAIARAHQVNKEGYAQRMHGSISIGAAIKEKIHNASE
jgi:bifunctional UDP-N-acetylglucosamine pyrophosphorylase/glucosamine-1-phosphate N-acetyltransferase